MEYIWGFLNKSTERLRVQIPVLPENHLTLNSSALCLDRNPSLTFVRYIQTFTYPGCGSGAYPGKTGREPGINTGGYINPLLVTVCTDIHT